MRDSERRAGAPHAYAGLGSLTVCIIKPAESLMMHSLSPRGFTKIELLVVLVILVALTSIILPMLGREKRLVHTVTNDLQLRGIHQALMMYAQINGEFYPGLNAKGKIVNATVEGRCEPLLIGNYFTGGYIVSPLEVKPEWTTGPVTSNHYSYAMLDIDVDGHRHHEWRDTLNTEAIAVSDRNAGTADDVYSLHTSPGQGWRGNVVFNDNHVQFVESPILRTRMGQGSSNQIDVPVNPNDHLFESDGPDDALMIHQGQ